MEQHEAFSRQAQACAELGSPMYAELLERAAADLRAGGEVGRVLAGHEDDPGPSALALRLLGSVHRLVLTSDAVLSEGQPALTGRRSDNSAAGELAAYYPSVGGTWSVEGGWEAFLRLLSEQPEAVREWLDRPPQTNEVGRASALMGGLLHVGQVFRHPVRLFEIGSSGGLNLLADRFGYVDEWGTTYGDPASPVRLDVAWQGRPVPPWPELDIVERVGSDVMPVDVRTTQGRLVLTAYVWPDQTHRLERLRGALDLAQHTPVAVRREGAARFVDGIDLRPGLTTVLWHSVMWQYLDAAEQEAVTARIGALGAQATDEAPFAHLFLEPMRRTSDGPHEFLVVLELWPTGGRRVLGSSTGHGLPTVWD
ncbi:MAG TPA: DUF2332 domain-containing protein [Nocardioides sp.]|uniref:DUF2332 domain-containing protein n=1 Tax=Nocardioides sp. TaxID=35761 RepID=UPI002D806860|nr:DUF2332 domain-containing protein [Nocardioides sp.]HET6653131.1 DUF2332 domain-containing protein [Nocardioides sp.]